MEVSKEALMHCRRCFRLRLPRKSSTMRYSACTFLLVLTLLLSNTYAQEYTTWGLPDGAKTRLGKGRISTIKFSPDGSQIAVVSPVGIWLYDSQTGKELALFPGHKPRFSTSVSSGVGSTLTIQTLAFSHDGRLLASVSGDGTIRLLDLTTYREHYPRLETKSIFVDPLQEVWVVRTGFFARRANPYNLGWRRTQHSEN